jgi:hypothetical protein
MSKGFPLTCLILLLHLLMKAQQDQKPADPRLSDALYRVSREAGQLWQTAPNFIGRELVTQKAVARSQPKFRPFSGALPEGSEPKEQVLNREIVSFYALAAFKGSPEALKEFRQIVSIDGRNLAEDEETTRAEFAATLASADNTRLQALRTQFEKNCLAGAAIDFGQLMLLFTKPNLEKYTFRAGGDGRVGADTALIIEFEQQTGRESLHISEGRRKLNAKLTGEIWVRQGDWLPLRIVLNSRRMRDRMEVRDEARVDYAVTSGALLPASLVYRHYLDQNLAFESIHRYSAWQPR